jgi:hypothetical protein
MTGFGRVFWRMAVTAAMLMANMTVSQAAGAFAVGNCGAYGFSYDYQQPAEASDAALGKCSGDCKVIPVRRACAAFAVDGANACGAHGYATAAKLGAAQNTALRQCYKYGGRDCVIRAWICDAKG